MTNKTRKQRGGVATPTRRNVRQRKLSAQALQNKRQNTYLLEQKQQETQRKLQKQLEKEEKELKKAAARASARLQFTNEDQADQSDSSLPSHSVGLARMQNRQVFSQDKVTTAG